MLSTNLWKLDANKIKTKEDLVIQLEMMTDTLFGLTKYDDLILCFAHIEGFVDGLMYANFINHFEHHEYLTPVVTAYHEALENIGDREAQT